MLKMLKKYKLNFRKSLNSKFSNNVFYFKFYRQLLPNNQDLYVSHDTWTEYESMLRILKNYKLMDGRKCLQYLPPRACVTA